MLLHEIERLSTKLVFAAKSNKPEDIPSKETVLEWINEIKSNSVVSE